MIYSYIGMAIFLILIYFSYSSFVSVIVLMTVAHSSMALPMAASPALYADSVVYATWKTGKNAAGWIMGLQNLPLKIAVFPSRNDPQRRCLVASAGRRVSGLEGIPVRMTLSFALIPGFLCIAGALLLMFGFRLTRDKVAKYQAEIDARG